MNKRSIRIIILLLFVLCALFFGPRSGNGDEAEEKTVNAPAPAARTTVKAVNETVNETRYDSVFRQAMNPVTEAGILRREMQHDEALAEPVWTERENQSYAAAGKEDSGMTGSSPEGEETYPDTPVDEEDSRMPEGVYLAIGDDQKKEMPEGEESEGEIFEGKIPESGQSLEVYEESSVSDRTPKKRVSRLNLEVKCILQNPELPTGCEVTSLAAVLNWMGYEIDKVKLARDYLPMNGIAGEDSPFDIFIGDPERDYAYGCYPPVIVHTANALLRDRNEYVIHAVNFTGSTLSEVFDYMAENGSPAIVWVTQYLEEPYNGAVWVIDGKPVYWTSPNHCVVLYGYNKASGEVFVADPLVGNVVYDRKLFERRYEQLGEKAVVIHFP